MRLSLVAIKTVVVCASGMSCRRRSWLPDLGYSHSVQYKPRERSWCLWCFLVQSRVKTHVAAAPFPSQTLAQFQKRKLLWPLVSQLLRGTKSQVLEAEANLRVHRLCGVEAQHRTSCLGERPPREHAELRLIVHLCSQRTMWRVLEQELVRLSGAYVAKTSLNRKLLSSSVLMLCHCKANKKHFYYNLKELLFYSTYYFALYYIW